MLKLSPLLVAAALIAGPAAAQAPAAPAAGYPKLVPAPGGEVVIPTPGAQRAYDEVKYAPARRAGDYLYISGVIAGPRGGAERDAAAFTEQVRRAFRVIEVTLKAEGLTFADVAMINTFHVWDGPGFKGTRDEQFAAFAKAKDEFMPAPHPAWTAVGTTGLLADDGVVEIQMIAYAPRKR
ncbi:Rid family hydrolase [Phenylobacterium sp.]|uniref:Rid family hydrolase n=1 Tax=Phenylobacterium sp. TaxID=1871053 RepID=UPI0025E64DA9|nr:Rid family hydrolase [Phenylobacterium sp.]